MQKNHLSRWLGLRESASKRLASRIETGEILSGRPDRIRTLWFRAGVIIGAGDHLRWCLLELPVMITPRWVRATARPVRHVAAW